MTKNSKDRFKVKEKGTRTRRMPGHSRGQRANWKWQWTMQILSSRQKKATKRHINTFFDVFSYIYRRDGCETISKSWIFTDFLTFSMCVQPSIVILTRKSWLWASCVDGVCDKLGFSPSRLKSSRVTFSSQSSIRTGVVRYLAGRSLFLRAFDSLMKLKSPKIRKISPTQIFGLE